MGKRQNVNAETVRGLFDYSPDSGVFVNKVTRGNKRKGTVAGIIDHTGYVRITINRVPYLAHRLAWLYVYGEWPAKDIDHKNRNRSDNRITNLRLADKSENQFNKSVAFSNKLQLKNICETKHLVNGIWYSYYKVSIDKKPFKRIQKNFKSLDDAIMFRDAMLEQYHKNFASLG